MPSFETEPAATNNTKPAPATKNEGRELPFRISTDKRSFIDFTATGENKITLEFYTEDGLKNTPKTIYKYNQTGNLEETLVRKSADSTEWSVYKNKDGKQELSTEKWQGNFALSNNTGKLELSISPFKNNPSGLELIIDAEGNKKYQKANTDGSLLIGNEKLQLTEVRRSDGTKILIIPEKEIVSESINYLNKEKTTTTWKYNQENKIWISNDGTESKVSPLSTTGFISYLDQKKDLHSISLDGTKGLRTRDNSFIQQKDNKIIIQSGDKVRVVEFGEDNKISSIKLYSEGKFQTSMNLSDFKTFKINTDSSIECKKEDGSRLLLNNDLSLIEIDNQGKIIKSISSSGTQRTFTYDNSGKLKEINESSKSADNIKWYAFKENIFIKSSNKSLLTQATLVNLSFDEFGRIKNMGNFAEIQYQTNSNQIQKLIITEANGGKKIYERQADNNSNWVVNPGKKEFTGNIFLTSKAELAFHSGEKEAKLITPLGKSLTEEFKTIKKWEPIIINNVNLKGDFEFTQYGKKQTSLASSQGGINGHYPHQPLLQARKVLFDAIDQNYSPERSHRLKCCLAYFEHRIKLIADYQTQLGKVNAREEFGSKIEKTYLGLANLIKEEGLIKQYGKASRLNIAEQIIAQVAEPRAINQGLNDTCNISTVEIYTAAIEPQNYVKVISDLVLKNTFSTAQNKGYIIDSRISTPENIPRQYRPNDDHTSFDLNYMVSQLSIRTTASMLFQRGAINGTRLASGHSGLFLNGNPNFNFQEIVTASNLINGYKMPYIIPWGQYQLEIDTNAPMPNNKGETIRNGNLKELFYIAEKKVSQNGLPFGFPTFGNEHVQVVFPQFFRNADGSVRYHTTFGDNTWGVNGDQAKSWVGNFDKVLKGQLPIPIEKIFNESK